MDIATRTPTTQGGTAHELRESLFLLTLTLSCLGAYVGLGVVAVRLFGGQ
jgi:hypothetical protein